MNTIRNILIIILMPFVGFASNSKSDRSEKLFDDIEPIQLILQMDMKKVLNDKSDDPEYSKAFLIQKISDTKIQSFNIKIRARGNTRRINDICEFPPLKINFQKKSTTNTIFEGQDKIKLVTHCQESDEYQNYAMLEYLAYKTYNALTDFSYQVRLVNVIYRDTEQNYPDIEKTGFMIEDDDLLAERLGGEITKQRIWSPDSCDQDVVDIFSLFQFMIGNTDWWIHTRHNVDILKLENNELIPLPFDFDYAGIINTPYAVPSPELPIIEVKDRFFKGSCKSPTDFSQTVALFNSRKDNIISLLDKAAFLDRKYRRTSIRYVEAFYQIINDPEKFSAYLNQTCEFAKGNTLKRNLKLQKK